VHSYLGWEQEYFLVDERLWAARPDLMLTGRTLMGFLLDQQLTAEFLDHASPAVVLDKGIVFLGRPARTA